MNWRVGLGVAVVVAGLAAGCSREKPKGSSQVVCNPECSPWEQCRDGACVEGPLQLVDPLVLGPAALPAGRVGVRYEQALSALNAPAEVLFALGAGALPEGLELDAAGLIAGLPASAGSWDFEISAVAGERTGKRGFTVVIDPSALSFPSTRLPLARVGEAYEARLTASGGSAPYRFAFAAGDLPAGVALGLDGRISGVPQTAGSFRTQVAVTDSSSVPQSAAAWFNLTVRPEPLLLSGSLPEAMVGHEFAAQLTALGGTAPFVFELAAGSLPAGMALSAEGALAGVPLQAGLFELEAQVRDSTSPVQLATLSLQLAVLERLGIEQLLPFGRVGEPFAEELAAIGGRAPYSFQLVGGVLPAGLALAAGGQVDGLPQEPGTSLFEVRVTDASAPAWDAVQTVELTVLPPLLQLAAAALPEGVVGLDYRAALAASGGQPPFLFSLLSGALPAGLALGQGGALHGVPLAAGSFDFVAGVQDAAGQRASGAFTVRVQSRLELVTDALPLGTLGLPYGAALEARGGVPPYSFRLISGSLLPAGLALAADGAITGTPLVAGTSTLVVELFDSGATPQSASGEVALGVSPDGESAPLAIVTPALPPTSLGASYRTGIDVVGGSRPYFVSLAFGSVLPAGLMLSSSGVISGTPLHAGTYRIVVQADDSSTPAQVALRGYTLLVAPESGAPLELTTNWLPRGEVGLPYRAELAAQGGLPPYRFGITAPSRLPSGLYVDASGALQGTPLSAGRFTFTAAVWDASSPYQMATATLSLQIGSTQPGEAVLVLTGALRKAKVNVPYEQRLDANGGSGSYAWRVVWGMLPPGLTLGADGRLAGTALAQGTFGFAVEVQDQLSQVAAQANLSLFVLATGAAGVRIMTPGFPDAEVGVPYDRGLLAIGGMNPYQFALSGQPPALELLLDSGTHRAALAGVPEVSGLFRMLVSATDSAGTSGLYYEHLAVYPRSSELLFSTSMLPDGKVGLAYALTLGASGGTAPYSYELTRGGALPTELALAPDGRLAGMPRVAGLWSVTIRVTDAAGASAEAQFWLQIME